jgi:predicted transposase/invertase (TIGR01784 family)
MTDITPRIDIVFKKLFGVEENKDLLMSLINSIISDADQVDKIEILNPYNEKNFKNDKLSILDIKARNKKSKQLFNIEMQISNEGHYDKRALYNWSKLYAGQLFNKGKYVDLKKTIGIHILNFSSVTKKLLSTLKQDTDFTYDNRYHYQFNMREKTIPFNYFDDIELHVIELSSFENREAEDELAAFLPKIKSSLDRWVMFLTKQEFLIPEKLPKQLNRPEIKKALQVMKLMSLNKEERGAYEDHLKWLRIQEDTLDKRYLDGKIEGRIEGKAEGRIEEREIQEQKLSDTIKTIVTNLHLAGQSVEFIAKVTKMSAKKVQEIIDTM